MFAKAKGVAIAACVLLCTLSLMGGRPNVPRQPRTSAAMPVDGAVADETVLVEAFVVEVSLPALAGLDVSPIGQEPQAVSVADILKCLDTGHARVIGGAKAASQPQARTAAGGQATETRYLRSEKGSPPAASYNAYQSSRRFSVGADLVSESAVLVQFNYTQTRFVSNAEDSDVPPNTMNWEWSGSVVLEPGRPQIVAASQDSETVVFLLLTAHVQSD